ncbi:MAG TPA: hypothetical protein PK413_01110 [Thermoanaerobaculia bacterium]|nr:hypothetical protein [Thermoanaerobaculia bacterium]
METVAVPVDAERPRARSIRELLRAPALWLSLASLAVSLRLLQWARLDLVMDDSFIYFRYARNLARGFGPVFNPGERVEGYTSFLWIALLAVGDFFGIDLSLFAGLLNLAATLGTIWLLYRFTRLLAPAASRWVWLLPSLIFSVGATQARYVGAGMETPIYVLLVAWSVYLYLAGKAPRWVGLAFSLTTLMRPEAVLYLTVVLLYELVAGEGESFGQRFRRAFSIGLWWAAVYLPYFGLRWAYYGYFLPNTFYAKVGSAGSTLLARGLKLLAQTTRETSLELPAALALLGVLFGRGRARFLAGAMVVVTVAYFLSVGGDFLLLFGPRFLLPAYPALLVLAALALARLAELPRPRRLGPALAATLALALAVNAAWLSWPRGSDRLELLAAVEHGWIEVGRWLAANSPPDATFAVGAAGAMPFFSDRTTIDMLGLNDLHIAHRSMPVGWGYPGHEKFDTGYILERKPDFLVFLRLDKQGEPILIGDWKEYKERVLAAYQVVALALSIPNRKGLPWIVETSEATPELRAQGYVVAVLKRRDLLEKTPATKP